MGNPNSPQGVSLGSRHDFILLWTPDYCGVLQVSCIFSKLSAWVKPCFPQPLRGVLVQLLWTVTAHMHSPLQLICLCLDTCMCKPCTWHSSMAICSTVSRAQTGAVTTEAGMNGVFIAQESRHGSQPWKESKMVWTVLSHLFWYLLFWLNELTAEFKIQQKGNKSLKFL